MLFLLSPAKSLDYDTPLPEGLPHTTPQFVPQSTALIEVLRTQSPQQIASLMVQLLLRRPCFLFRHFCVVRSPYLMRPVRYTRQPCLVLMANCS